VTAALHLVPPPVSTGRDPDLVDYLHWARELKGYAENTVRIRGDVLDRLAESVSAPLRHLTEGDLLGWERRAVSGRSPETRRAYVCHVRAFYAWAVDKARIRDTNPALVLTIPKIPRAVPRPMEEEQLRAALLGARPKMRVWLLLGAFCGLRCVEIAGLQWTDLRMSEQPTLHVRGKGGEERIVPVPAVVLAALDGYGRRRTGPMFYGLDAQQVSAKTVSHCINRFLSRRGIDATAHQLRHRYATAGYQLTRDIRLMQEMLGHRDPKTTARYAQYDKSHAAEMVRQLDEQWAAHG